MTAKGTKTTHITMVPFGTYFKGIGFPASSLAGETLYIARREEE
jgi:hypothetical protein